VEAPQQIASGYVLVDKPVGPSSHAAVQQVRRALGFGGRRGTKAGHAGTLDPFASGLLVVLLGRATRLMPFVVGHDKRYEVHVRFGASSTTDDREGELERDDRPHPTQEQVLAALPALAAQVLQVPPAVSAIHVDGERAYRRVRRGETIEVPPRPVRFDGVELLRWEPATDGDPGPLAVFDVRCATGTYMRALARDLGEAVDCAAFCEELRRLEVGAWGVADAVAPADVTAAHVRDARELLAELATMQLDAEQLEDIANGRRVSASDAPASNGDFALLAPDGSLAALARRTSDGAYVQPKLVLVESVNRP
jgi:tRNA pseudouridine55 synthase